MNNDNAKHNCNRRNFASSTLVLARLHALRPEDIDRLRAIAQWASRGMGDLSEDILQEAIKRSLTLERKWYEGEDFLSFLTSAICSLAYNCRQDRYYQRCDNETLGNGQVASSGNNYLSLRVQHTDISDLIFVEILQGFAEDTIAQQILCCRQFGFSAAETKQVLGLDEQAYAAACKRISRRKNRYKF
jgi:hypothetical protein